MRDLAGHGKLSAIILTVCMNIKALLHKPILGLAALATVGAGAGIGAIASAQTAAPGTSATATTPAAAGSHRGMPGVFGKITAISGDTITIESQAWNKTSSGNTTTYTVDATNAAITVGQKGSAPTTSTISSLAVGDMIGVEGTVSGTNVAATKITEGMGGFGMGRGGPGMGGRGTEGTVTSVSGNTITITKQDGTTETIDASSATVSKMVTENVSDIQVGDRISADGTTSGTTVTAKHIMDGIPAAPTQAAGSTATQN